MKYFFITIVQFDDVNSIVYRFISSKSPNIVIQIGKKVRNTVKSSTVYFLSYKQNSYCKYILIFMGNSIFILCLEINGPRNLNVCFPFHILCFLVCISFCISSCNWILIVLNISMIFFYIHISSQLY